MKCPKCNAENKENSKFCIKCGANIAEELAKVKKEEKEKEAQEIEKKTTEKQITEKEEKVKKKKASEDKKKLAEIRKKEKEKMEEKIKEAEKAEAIRQAKQEGIELEIIDKETEKEPAQQAEPKKFTKKENVKEKKEKNKKVKKQKVVIKKNIFQRIFNKLLFIIVVAAIIIGAVYYCYTQKLLPEFIQKEVEDFDYKLQNVINNYKEVEEGKTNTQNENNSNEEWIVEPNVEADDIKDLTQEVSAIVKDGKYGIINNTTCEILLEPKYTNIYYGEYYDIDKTEQEKTKGIIVKDIEKFYKVDSSYKISTEINVVPEQIKNTYFYDHHGEKIYESTPTGETTEVKKTTGKEIKACTDIDIVTTDGQTARNADLPESFTIDFDKSTTTTKGYFDMSKGELVINCDYDEVYEFSDRYAAVKFQNKAGIIDKEGNRVVELKFEETRSVHNGTAFVKQNGKWGILKIQ